MSKEVTTLGGGCFWCLEAVYDEMKGVESVESGYMGGHVENPTYRAVCTGTTGHNEVVQITFDTDVVSFDDILNVFFTIHDPTTLNRQGNDIGTQYRSEIFYHSEEQREAAEAKIKQIEAEGIWNNPVVTRITEKETFYIAEDYHQEYFANNPNAGYCRVVVAPKVVKFRQKFTSHLKEKA
ncbi:MAG: peptide-methionine (S)-S-oxide reductase MsrA [Chloroflexota bacterium]